MKRTFKGLFPVMVLFIVFLDAKSQSLPLSSINLIEKYHINKAYAGISGNKMLNFNVRQQWINVENFPKSFTSGFYSPVFILKGAAGLECSYQNLGAHSQYTLNLSYNYIHKTFLGDFSLGFGAGNRSIILDREKILTPDGFYENGNYNPNDDYLILISGKNISFLKVQLFFVYIYKNVEIGMEFDKDINISKNAGISGNDLLKINFQYQLNYNENLNLRLHGLFYSDFKVFQSDLGITGIIKKNYIAGFNFRGFSKRTIESIALIGGADISQNIKLIYAYDIGINSLQRIHNGSHEIRVLVNLGQPDLKRKLPPVIFNPRLY
ncbi:MAG: type IX secretion system membrane protein PorP/SprF [Saprospiraceae bacterium]